LRAKREFVDAAGRLPRRKAHPKIRFNPRGSLVTLLRSLGEELHHHRRELGGHVPCPIAGRDWLSHKVVMNKFDRIGRGEGEPTGQQLIESHSQSVEVTPGIDRPIHPAGLFRRHIGERPSYHLRRLGQAVFTGQARSNSETCEPCPAASEVNQDICWFDVLVDEALLMCPPERHDERDRNAEEARGFQRSPEKSVERFAAGIFEHQHGSIAVAHQLQGSRRPRPIQLILQSEFVGQTIEARARRAVCGRQNDEHGLAYAFIARAPPSAQEAFAVL
jgi:hypothetical protein